MALPGLVAANNLSDVVDREAAWDALGENISITFDNVFGDIGTEVAPVFVPITISGYQAIEREGEVSLWINVSSREYAVSANDGTTFTTIIRDGVPVVEGQYGVGVVPVAAENIAGTNQILWIVSGTFFVWTMTSSWVYVSATGINITSPDAFDLEIIFRVDLNGDGILGENKILIETAGSGSTLLYIGEISRAYRVSNDAGVTFITVIYLGNPVIEGQFGAGIFPLAAENIEGINQILWKVSPTQVITWRLTSSWVHASDSPFFVIGPNTVDLEIAFHADINNDGVAFSINGRDILALNGVRNTSTRDFALIKGLTSPAQPRITAVAQQIALIGDLQNSAMPQASPTTSGNYFFSSGITLSGVSTRINGTPALSIATSPFSGSTATASILLRELQPQANWRITEPMPSGTIANPEFAIPFETSNFVLFMKTGQS